MYIFEQIFWSDKSKLKMFKDGVHVYSMGIPSDSTDEQIEEYKQEMITVYESMVV